VFRVGRAQVIDHIWLCKAAKDCVCRHEQLATASGSVAWRNPLNCLESLFRLTTHYVHESGRLDRCTIPDLSQTTIALQCRTFDPCLCAASEMITSHYTRYTMDSHPHSSDPSPLLFLLFLALSVSTTIPVVVIDREIAVVALRWEYKNKVKGETRRMRIYL
jgi:hypothetical protein